jgi:hypothetical protein
VDIYVFKAHTIHMDEVRPYCPSCHEVLNDVVADLFGFSLMKHMAFCCPDLLARIEESVLPPIRHTRRGVMGAVCLLCNQQFGLAGYGTWLMMMMMMMCFFVCVLLCNTLLLLEYKYRVSSANFYAVIY